MAENKPSKTEQSGGPIEQRNPFQVAARAGGLVSIEQQRAIAQVQAAMLVARAMPRNRIEALDQIIHDCTDIELAEQAEYQYSRGGSDVSGPSIRLLEAVARRWGNLETGIEEISRQDGYSEFRAFAMDLETGWRDSKVFQVKHWRDTKQGGYPIKDERDIYELGANMGARRKRACMEAIIPSDVIRQASEQCALTLKAKIEITPEFVQSMLDNFAKFAVTKEMIEKRIQRHITAISPGMAVQLRRIYNAMRDGMAVPSDFFDTTENGEAAKPKTGAAALKEAVAGEKPAAKSDLGGPPDFKALMVLIERALESKSKEIALLQLEDVDASLSALAGDELKAAKKALDAARVEVKDRKAAK